MQFVSTVGADVAHVFAAVLAICDAQGLIGREMFAIDGVKLPGNASTRRSGTRADFERQAAKCEVAAAAMLARHRAEDARPAEPDLVAKDTARRERLEHDATELRAWLAAHPADRRGPSGGVRKRNRTDADSAKMATGKGVIQGYTRATPGLHQGYTRATPGLHQGYTRATPGLHQGYTGVAAVDSRHQIIMEAQAHGTGAEQELLVPVVTALAPMLTPDSLVTADAGYHSEANLRHLAERGVEALVADRALRRRDERFATSASRRRTGAAGHQTRCTTSPTPRPRPRRFRRARSRTTPMLAPADAPPASPSTARAGTS